MAMVAVTSFQSRPVAGEAKALRRALRICGLGSLEGSNQMINPLGS